MMRQRRVANIQGASSQNCSPTSRGVEMRVGIGRGCRSIVPCSELRQSGTSRVTLPGGFSHSLPLTRRLGFAANGGRGGSLQCRSRFGCSIAKILAMANCFSSLTLRISIDQARRCCHRTGLSFVSFRPLVQPPLLTAGSMAEPCTLRCRVAGSSSSTRLHRRRYRRRGSVRDRCR